MIERIAIVVVLALLGALYRWGSQYWVDPFEEGYFAYLVSRILSGHLPYHDFATPYTPGYFYIQAFLAQIFGLTLIGQRVGVIVARLLGALLLYVAARRMAPPRYAILAPLSLLLLDPSPVPWHPHPSWFAAPAALGSALAIARYLDSARLCWLVLAGLLCGVSFAIKQNTGLLALLAGGTFLGICVGRSGEVRTRSSWLGWVDDLPLAPRLARLLPIIAAVGLPLAFLFALRARIQIEYLMEYVVPLAVLNVWLLRNYPSARPRLSEIASPLVTFGVSFGAFTLPWLLALIAALGRHETPLRQFVGGVDPEGYILDQWWPHPEGLAFLAVPLFVVGSICLVSRGRLLAGLAMFAACIGVVLVAAGLTVDPSASMIMQVSTGLTQITENVDQSLPAIEAWLVVLALWRGVAGTGKQALLIAWFLTYGCALFFHQYPRMDEPHLIFSAPPMAIGFAWFLSVLEPRLVPGGVRSVSGVLIVLTVLFVPIVSIWPVVSWRWSALEPERGRMLSWSPRTYEPVQNQRAGVLAPPYIGEPLAEITREVNQRAAPDEPIFAFPATPMVYFFADRPNVSRFNHFLEGLVTPEEERGVIHDLDERRVRFIVMEPAFEYLWLREEDYAPLRSFIRSQFHLEREFGPYQLWSRSID